MTNKYITIDVTEKSVKLGEFKTLQMALESVGLTTGEVDWSGMGHTADKRHITLMAYEFGLRPDWNGGRQFKYCRIGRQMYAGNLVIFAADEMGENADMREGERVLLEKHIEWLDDEDDCEVAIAEDRMDRPQMSVNGEIMWEWNKERMR